MMHFKQEDKSASLQESRVERRASTMTCFSALSGTLCQREAGIE